jgi:antitoxin component YwqK of YwqJK toxin-antitoxin module
MWRKNQLHGITRRYSESGTLIEEQCYQEGRQVLGLAPCSGTDVGKGRSAAEVVRRRYPSGQVEEEYTVADGKLQGEKRSFYKSGQLREVAGYRDGQLHGMVKTFYENGRPRQATSYKGGTRDGEDVQYFDTGGVSQRDVYKDGRLLSTRTYYQNGRPRTEDIHGESGSIRREFYDSGALRYEAGYKLAVSSWGEQRVPDGLERRLREDGTPESETTYQRGVRHGPSREFYKNGRLKEERIYEKDRLVRQRTYDEDGRLKTDDEFFPDGSRKPRR